MEILAPCGGTAHVRAAVDHGTDAVYLGAGALNARRNAGNFTEEELHEAARYCHQYGVKLYLTVNTLVFDREGDALRSLLALAAELPADALILQDWGAAAFAGEMLPDMPRFASTQCAIHTPEGARMAQELGFSRVVLARELSAPQIGEILKTGVDAEVFVHGALCGSVSGQCYLSAALGTRSGNRGLCAQPCRLDFRAGDRPYALSLKDLSLMERVRELRELGVASLKIEGRMKRPEYVAAAVDALRKALDGQAPDMARLAAVFSRQGFTSAYFDGTRKEMQGRRTMDNGQWTMDNFQENGKRETLPLAMELTVAAGEPSRLRADDGEFSVTVSGAIPEVATHQATDAAEAENRLGKLGGTLFHVEQFRADIGPGLRLSAAALNGLRRAAVEALVDLRSRRPARRVADADWLPPAEPHSYPARPPIVNCQLSIVNCASPPRWMAGREDEVFEELKALQAKGCNDLLCRNLAHIGLGRKLGMNLHGGWELNVTNARSLAALRDLGLRDCVLSPELTAKQCPEAGIPVGRLIYGRLPVMLLTRCPVRDDAPRKNCKDCRPLTDRTGRSFPLRCDGHSVEVLNADPLWMGDRLDELKADFFVALDEIPEAPFDKFTRGAYTRGVE